jgi:hypothetical protein
LPSSVQQNTVDKNHNPLSLTFNNTQNNNQTYRIYGFYTFNSPKLLKYGIEYGVAHLGSFTYFYNKSQYYGTTNVYTTGNASTVDIAGTAAYYMLPWLSFLGKLGLVGGYLEISNDGDGEGGSGSNKNVFNIMPEIALGASADLNKRISINLTLTHVFGKSNVPTVITDISDINAFPSVDVYALGVQYRFA